METKAYRSLGEGVVTALERLGLGSLCAFVDEEPGASLVSASARWRPFTASPTLTQPRGSFALVAEIGDGSVELVHDLCALHEAGARVAILAVRGRDATDRVREGDPRLQADGPPDEPLALGRVNARAVEDVLARHGLVALLTSAARREPLLAAPEEPVAARGFARTEAAWLDDEVSAVRVRLFTRWETLARS